METVFTGLMLLWPRNLFSGNKKGLNNSITQPFSFRNTFSPRSNYSSYGFTNVAVIE